MPPRPPTMPETPATTPGESTVFLTGLVRCGSSWVGQVLGAAAGTRYVYEPFNPHWTPGLTPDWRQFTYLRPGEQPPAALIRTARAAFRGRQGLKAHLRAAYRGYLWSTLRPACRVLVKDPTACLASAWIHQAFAPRMVLVTRHPCGFASSIHLHGWRVRLRALLRQEKLMDDWLAPFEDVLRRADQDEWARLGAFWGAVHRVLHGWWSQQPRWRVISYEDLCAQPQAAFARLASDCGLGWSAQALARTLSPADRDHSDSGATRRDATRMAGVWRERMSPGQVDAVTGAVRALGMGYDGAVLGRNQPA